MKKMSKNARDIYDFKNKIINDIKKKIGEDTEYAEGTEKIKDTEELILHRSKEEIK